MLGKIYELENIIQILEKEVKALSKSYGYLEEANANLEKENKKLKRDNQTLEKENENLSRKGKEIMGGIDVSEAIEKQIPKKPIEKHYEDEGEEPYIKYACPNNCGIQLWPKTSKNLAHEHAYCPKCGQKIDWEGMSRYVKEFANATMLAEKIGGKIMMIKSDISLERIKKRTGCSVKEDRTMMENTIRDMISLAEDEYNLDLISSVREVLDTFASTINCPSNWRNLGTELEKEYSEGSWVYENLELWNYVE